MCWYVMHLRPKTEKKVAEVCRIHGIEHYLPLREETKIYQRRKVTVHKPLFPGYVFARIPLETRIHVQRTNHLISLLKPDDEARLVYELDQIRRALEADPRLEADQAYREGRRVRIRSGVFLGVEGILQSLRGQAQVRLNVEMIGQSITVDVERDSIEFMEE